MIYIKHIFFSIILFLFCMNVLWAEDLPESVDELLLDIEIIESQKNSETIRNSNLLIKTDDKNIHNEDNIEVSSSIESSQINTIEQENNSSSNSEEVLQNENNNFESEGIINLNSEELIQKENDCETAQIEYIPLDIDYPDHPLVLKYHSEFNSDFGKKWINIVMERAQPYRPYIRQKLKENNMPACLEYLPVIESSYNINAVSKSGAVGLWQFMENSIHGFLNKNDWADERKDPWLSTDAALKKLTENYSYFKDWGLALAAYNMGFGGLKQAIKKSGKTTLWELIDSNALRPETKNYVPKFLALADLITNATYYNIDIPEFNENNAINFTTVHLEGQVGLEQLCRISGIDIKQIQSLNPSLIYPVTPYGMEYTLRIPSGFEESTIKAIKEIGTYPAADIYTVKHGDTLWGISRRYGLSVDTLCKANNIRESDILRIGKNLFVPIFK